MAVTRAIFVQKLRGLLHQYLNTVNIYCVLKVPDYYRKREEYFDL
jgi:hypothetical protein